MQYLVYIYTKVIFVHLKPSLLDPSLRLSDLAWALGICIPNKVLSDADADGSEHPENPTPVTLGRSELVMCPLNCKLYPLVILNQNNSFDCPSSNCFHVQFLACHVP